MPPVRHARVRLQPLREPPQTAGFIITAMLNRKLFTGIAALLVAAFATAQTPRSPQQVRDLVREYRRQHEGAIVRDFAKLLALPNMASDTPNIRANASFIMGLLEQRGFSTLALNVPGAPPAVYGELKTPGATHTLLWYAHYDGQPVDKAQWAGDPWQPVLREGGIDATTVPLDSLNAPLNPEWRIYARSAGDDKAPVQTLLTAIDALKAANVPLSVNLKVFFEGEEEAGSPPLERILRENADVLKGDLWLLSDGPVHQTRRMQLFFGARGVTDLELTVYGPARVLHDGHYGNWAPNPAAVLVDLLAHMRDAGSHILIPGFYDDV